MDELQRRALLRAAVAGLVVLLVGSAAVYGVDQLRPPGGTAGSATAGPSATASATAPGPAAQGAWLAWVPGGIPEGVGPAATTIPVITQATTATSDIAWLQRSLDASSVVVDDPPDPYLIPLDVTGVEPAFASFVPQPERALVEGLNPGEGLLSESAAAFRGLGEGATLDFASGARVTVAGTLPDVSMGGHELLVTKGTGQGLGVTHGRYILFRVREGVDPSPARVAAQVLPLLPLDVPIAAVEVRAPGETRFLRANDRELPPFALKLRFGEFTALPDQTGRGPIEVDPAWVEENIVQQDVPILGSLTCHRRAFRPLGAAMAEIESAGDGALVRDHAETCYDPSLDPDDPEGLLTAVDFGAAIELNRPANRPGDPAEQPPALVTTMFGNGFGWGGKDAWPQGALFRYRRYPTAAA